MKYIGNKFRLLPFINKVVIQEKLPKRGVFCDIFSGTTSVAQFYKKKKCKLATCDIMYYSYVFQYTYIKINKYPSFLRLLRHEKKILKEKKRVMAESLFNQNENQINLQAVIWYLNKLQGEPGFVYSNYSPGGTSDSSYHRQFFSNDNAKKIDAIRNWIQLWKDNKIISDAEFYILLCSLIDAADFVANISGTYGAFLKIWRSMALKPIKLLQPQLIESDKEHDIYLDDANNLIDHIHCDILYLDPPYNTRQYASNFHVLETIARWDTPKIYGKTGLRPYEEQKSDYCKKGKCEERFKELIRKANCKYILMSYNNEGIIRSEFIKEVLSEKGNLKVYTQPYRRFRTESDHEKRHYKVHNDVVIEKVFVVKVH